MKVSASLPFQIVYSLYQHEYLGYLFESCVIHLDDNGKLTLQHQNISSKNADEFAKGLDSTDYELIELMDSMQQDAVVKKFNTKGPMKPDDFFLKMFSNIYSLYTLYTKFLYLFSMGHIYIIYQR